MQQHNYSANANQAKKQELGYVVKAIEALNIKMDRVAKALEIMAAKP